MPSYIHHTLTRLNVHNVLFVFQIIEEDEDGIAFIANQAEIRLWERKEILAKNCIFSTIGKEMKQNLYTPGLTSAQMMTELVTQYEVNTEEQLHLLYQEYYDFTYKEGMQKKINIYIFSLNN